MAGLGRGGEEAGGGAGGGGRAAIAPALVMGEQEAGRAQSRGVCQDGAGGEDAGTRAKRIMVKPQATRLLIEMGDPQGPVIVERIDAAREKGLRRGGTGE